MGHTEGYTKEKTAGKKKSRDEEERRKKFVKMRHERFQNSQIERLITNGGYGRSPIVRCSNRNKLHEHTKNENTKTNNAQNPTIQFQQRVKDVVLKLEQNGRHHSENFLTEKKRNAVSKFELERKHHSENFLTGKKNQFRSQKLTR